MKKRVLTALILLIICLPIIYIGGRPFYIFATLVSVIGYRELINLITDKKEFKIVMYFCFLIIILSNITKNSFNDLLDYHLIGIISILFSILGLLGYKNNKLDVGECFKLLGMTFFLGMSFSIIIIVRNMSLKYFIYLFLITILTDTFALFTGMLFGKHKMTKISPNKTWEGFVGGCFFGTLLCSLFYLIFIDKTISLLLLIAVTLFLTIIGQIGDLFFSLIKRHYKIKDFSNLLPGHGGVLDRLDSIIFVMLLITFFIELI